MSKERSTRRTPVTPYRIEWLCSTGTAEECQGTMVFAGEAITQGFGGTNYKHRCSTCDRFEWADEQFPRVYFVDNPARTPLRRSGAIVSPARST